MGGWSCAWGKSGKRQAYDGKTQVTNLDEWWLGKCVRLAVVGPTGVGRRRRRKVGTRRGRRARLARVSVITVGGIGRWWRIITTARFAWSSILRFRSLRLRWWRRYRIRRRWWGGLIQLLVFRFWSIGRWASIRTACFSRVHMPRLWSRGRGWWWRLGTGRGRKRTLVRIRLGSTRHRRWRRVRTASLACAFVVRFGRRRCWRRIGTRRWWWWWSASGWKIAAWGGRGVKCSTRRDVGARMRKRRRIQAQIRRAAWFLVFNLENC